MPIVVNDMSRDAGDLIKEQLESTHVCSDQIFISFQVRITGCCYFKT